jgi:hypothetical protein
MLVQLCNGRGDSLQTPAGVSAITGKLMRENKFFDQGISGERTGTIIDEMVTKYIEE